MKPRHVETCSSSMASTSSSTAAEAVEAAGAAGTAAEPAALLAARTAALAAARGGAAGPIHEKKEDVEVVWQIPRNARAVLFIAHAGRATPGSFWRPHPYCNLCIGLPEESSIVEAALQRGYAVIAVKSLRDYWQTWPPEASQDAINVEAVLDSWTGEHSELDKLPVVALGCASGGGFISMLALRMKFQALVIMLSHGVTRAFQRASSRYPPTLFVNMPKDSLTVSKVAQEMNRLQAKSVPSLEIQCLEFPIYSHYLSDRIQQLDAQASSKIYAALRLQGIINADGYVLSPMQPSEIYELLQWADIFPEECAETDKRLAAERINGLIRVAEARHAVTGRKCDEIFEWLEQYLIRQHL